jgi:hypothetical protein
MAASWRIDGMEEYSVAKLTKEKEDGFQRIRNNE